MKYRTRLAQEADWTDLAAKQSDYALSQTFEFGLAVCRAYGEYSYEPRWFEFEDGQKLFLPLVRIRTRMPLLRRFEAMPFSLRGMPLTNGAPLRSEHLEAVLRELRSDSLLLCGGAIDLAPGEEYLKANFADTAKELHATQKATHVLDLSGGFEEVWEKRFSGKVRNQCRMAQRKEVQVETAHSVEEFETYYEIYRESTQRWGYDEPPYPVALFRALASLRDKGVELKLARIEGQPVAGVLLMHGPRTTLYWGGALRKEFTASSPNNALLKIAIEQACENDKKWFDFGVSGTLDSVRKFKESFGALPIEYNDFRWQSARYKFVEKLRKRSAASRPAEKTS